MLLILVEWLAFWQWRKAFNLGSNGYGTGTGYDKPDICLSKRPNIQSSMQFGFFFFIKLANNFLLLGSSNVQLFIL